MGSCADNWIDVFITKSADDPTTRQHGAGDTESGLAYTYDDEFCCTVQSIEFDPDDVQSTAYITENDSEWILPTWSNTNQYGLSSASTSAYAQLKVGDLVRIGGIATAGFTDYLTVIEIRRVNYLANATDSAVTFTHGLEDGNQVEGSHYLPQPTSSSVPGTTANHRFTLSTAGIAHIAIRLNQALNCTTLPTGTLRHDTTQVVHRQNVSGYSNVTATLATRQHAYEYLTDPKPAFKSDEVTEQYYYPLYRAKNWTTGKELIARLDHGVKQVAVVKLLGYSLVNKRQVGIQHAHEMQTDDFLILRIKELDGHVISNNQYANGAFAILRAGDTSNNLIGAAEFSSYEPTGIVSVPVHASNNTIRNLTIEITDRLGNPAHFGRLHLWFKLLVTHG